MPVVAAVSVALFEAVMYVVAVHLETAAAAVIFAAPAAAIFVRTITGVKIVVALSVVVGEVVALGVVVADLLPPYMDC